MITPRLFVSLAFVLSLGAAQLLYGQSAGYTVTSTLVPMEKGNAISPGGFEIQQTERKTATLYFDLGSLPAGLTDSSFRRCTLRVVASEVMANLKSPNTGARQVLVKGYVGQDLKESVVALSRLEAKKEIPDQPPINVQTIAVQANPDLCTAIYNTYKTQPNKEFSITLATDTLNASSIFYSRAKASVEREFSRIPRLVIEYQAPAASFLDSLSWGQVQHDPEHTGRNGWKPFTPPSGLAVETATLPGNAAGHPLFYRGDLYVIYKTGSDNHLLCRDFSGKRTLWDVNIGAGTVENSPVVGPGGLLYVVTNNSLASYDLNREGAAVDKYPLTYKAGTIDRRLTRPTSMTVGNDGSVFVAFQDKDVNYMFGFTSKLVPFLRSTAYPRISTITVSASGDKIFAQTPKGAAVLDIANPKEGPEVPFVGEDRYNIPVAGPATGAMIFSASNEDNEGHIWSYAGTTKKWEMPPADEEKKNTSTSQPVLGKNERVYFLTGGKLHAGSFSKPDAAPPIAVSCGAGSNPVLDGDDNVYFWCVKGTMLGYNANGAALFAPVTVAGPVRESTFQLAPDGTLWTDQDKLLYALTPTYPKKNLPVTPGDIRTHTVYRTVGDLKVAENVKVGNKTGEPAMEVLFQAKGSISFAKGFSVEKGASLLCRTGF